MSRAFGKFVMCEDCEAPEPMRRTLRQGAPFRVYIQLFLILLVEADR
ncbi:hypothetical protein SCH4B_1221 [Ruegeria sp. TrichCH4B]|nr:hypothetical protein SCH4B_1221 [Ruegeria sp. TrichCH4B]